MTTESRPEPPGGSPHRTAPTPVVPVPPRVVPSPDAFRGVRPTPLSTPSSPTLGRAPVVGAPPSRRTTSASLVLATAGALAAVAAVAAFAVTTSAGQMAFPPDDERPPVLLDDRAVAAPAFALVTRAWSDDDGDGLRGGTEQPLVGVVAHLETADARPARHVDGSAVAAATTGPDGTAVFDDVAAGVYRVRWTLPVGHTLTTAVLVPGHALADSDAEPVGDEAGSGTGTAEGLSGPVALTESAGLDAPDPRDGVTADRLLRGVDVGAVPAAEVLVAAQG
ncbi:prealbumin-like fold domain-containing protein [Cellulomonas algicola]|uniref:prealbumin-like fold domain-containing protein n=1 Tax=Cellulomonas algicola TaxID=2071633 RepID=UPI001C3FC42B|nr:prealbumin-like fold domain-containing protein [Cellulomonas algicola]